MTCPNPHVWDAVLKADGSTWLVMRCDTCGALWACDDKRLAIR
jgi:hypothetical protein